MKLSVKNLKNIIESFLHEADYSEYKCPNCDHVHKTKPKNNKCENCGYRYGKDWHKKNENIGIIRSLYEQARKIVCPEPTKNLELNTLNRNRAIKVDHIKYGPLNLKDEQYWEDAAEHWNTTPEVAKESKCYNCVAFDISPGMQDCMPGLIMAQEEIEEAIEDNKPWETLGYCWMHHFKCHSARACYTWAAGGPIIDNKISQEFFDRNEEGALKKDPID